MKNAFAFAVAFFALGLAACAPEAKPVEEKVEEVAPAAPVAAPAPAEATAVEPTVVVVPADESQASTTAAPAAVTTDKK
jgi:hypothetical protein